MGSFLAGSHLSLFGRGGILVDYDIAHNNGLGYPCAVKDVSGGGCGMTGFGAPFPGFEPGFFYATPLLGGLQISLGLYDPAAIGNAQLNRTPLPRFEGEVKFDFKDLLRVFGSGFWQVLEGTPSGGKKDLRVVREISIRNSDRLLVATCATPWGSARGWRRPQPTPSQSASTRVNSVSLSSSSRPFVGRNPPAGSPMIRSTIICETRFSPLVGLGSTVMRVNGGGRVSISEVMGMTMIVGYGNRLSD